MKSDEMKKNMNIEDEYCSCLVDMNKEVNFITLLLNKNLFSYNLHDNSKCKVCMNEEVCNNYVSQLKKKILNMNRKDVYSTRIINMNRVTETYKDILKLNCETVILTSKRNRTNNKELRRRIEQMNLNKEEIKVFSI